MYCVFWGVWDKDIIGDEASYAFRSVGYLDYLGTNSQTQPVEWYKGGELPFGPSCLFTTTRRLLLSFKMYFLKFLEILCGRAVAVRYFWFVVGCFYLFDCKYFISVAGSWVFWRRLFFSLNNGLIGISRTALMEPVLIFLILVNIYSFFRFRENKNWWWVFGLTLGLAFLAKYTAIFLIPIYFIYLILFERKTFFPSGRSPV